MTSLFLHRNLFGKGFPSWQHRSASAFQQYSSLAACPRRILPSRQASPRRPSVVTPAESAFQASRLPSRSDAVPLAERPCAEPSRLVAIANRLAAKRAQLPRSRRTSLVAVSNQPVVKPRTTTPTSQTSLATVSNNGIPVSATQDGRFPVRCGSPQA